jgi:Holliday junction resolvasome RuvABC endonuclease subunit
MGSKLAKFAVDGHEAEEEVEAPDRLGPIIYKGRILAVDQSLGTTGWAWMTTNDGNYGVTDTGLIVTEPISGLTSYEEAFVRATNLYTYFRNLLDLVNPHLVVHEMPSVRPNPRAGLKDRDASMCSVMALRSAVREFGRARIKMLNAQHVKKVLTGDRGAAKKEVATAVHERIPGLRSRKNLRLNEHTHDAMALGIVIAAEETNHG